MLANVIQIEPTHPSRSCLTHDYAQDNRHQLHTLTFFFSSQYHHRQPSCLLFLQRLVMCAMSHFHGAESGKLLNTRIHVQNLEVRKSWVCQLHSQTTSGSITTGIQRILRVPRIHYLLENFHDESSSRLASPNARQKGKSMSSL